MSNKLFNNEPQRAESLEMIALKGTKNEWRCILSQLSPESREKLFEYAKLLILSQAQEHTEAQ